MRLLSVIAEPTRTLFLLKDRNGFTTAELHSSVRVPNIFAPGSLLRVSGINLLRMEGGLNYLDSSVHSEILVRSLDDVSLISPASWWTQARLTYLASALGVLTLAFLLLLFYSQLKHWRMETILRDRKRLAHDIHDTSGPEFCRHRLSTASDSQGSCKRRSESDAPRRNSTRTRSIQPQGGTQKP